MFCTDKRPTCIQGTRENFIFIMTSKPENRSNTLLQYVTMKSEWVTYGVMRSMWRCHTRKKAGIIWLWPTWIRRDPLGQLDWSALYNATEIMVMQATLQLCAQSLTHIPMRLQPLPRTPSWGDIPGLIGPWDGIRDLSDFLDKSSACDKSRLKPIWGRTP